MTKKQSLSLLLAAVALPVLALSTVRTKQICEASSRAISVCSENATAASRVTIKRPEAPQKNTDQAVDEETFVNVTVNLEYDSSKWFAMGQDLVVVENGKIANMYFPDFDLSTDSSVIFSVPDGTKCTIAILLASTDFNEIMVLGKQDITVNGESNYTLKASDAVNTISMHSLLPNGEEANVDLIDSDTYDLVSEGNSYYVGNSLYLKYNYPASSFTINEGRYTAEGGEKTDGRINIIRYMPEFPLSVARFTMAFNSSGVYTMMQATDSQSAQTDISNDTTSWTTYSAQCAPTPCSIASGFNTTNSAGFMASLTYDDCHISSSRIGLTSDAWKFDTNYFVSQNDQTGHFKLLTRPMFVEGFNEDFDLSNYTLTAPIGDIGGITVLGINNVGSFSDMVSLPKLGVYDTQLTHATNPHLNISGSEPLLWNYGCPIAVTEVRSQDWGVLWNHSYIGRYGEERLADKNLATIQMTVNGREASAEELEELQWQMLPQDATIDLTLTDNNVLVEGIEGFNKTTLHFNSSVADPTPPTLTFMRAITTDGKIQSRFNTGAEGIIEFYVADLVNKSLESNTSYIQWYEWNAPVEVKAEYRAHGIDNYRPLTVKHNPEFDFAPGFGSNYTASLVDVNEESADGWYDLRISLRDAVGNTQEQIISPAFFLESTTGVNDNNSDSMCLTISGRTISCNGTESPYIEIFAADGRKIISTQASTINLDAEYHGAYIIKATDNKQSKVAKILL